MRLKMFSALKLTSLKCQSNGGSENKRDKCDDIDDDEDEDDDLSDHMYEKLPSYDSNCKSRTNFNRSQKPLTSLTKRISKWKMECPGIANLRNTRPDDYYDSKNKEDESIGEIPNLEQSVTVRTKVTTVNIEREDGNLGITLRGGFHQNSDISRPVIITYVKPDGPAARQGTIKPGDRLLAVDGVSIQGSTLSDAQTLLRQPTATALLTIEYDVNVLDTVQHANGPLLVHLERSSTQQLGLTLLQNSDGIIIERVKPGSLADRSGALHTGDEILAVNTTRINGSTIAIEEVMKILECESPIIKLEILPSSAASNYSNCGTWKSSGFNNSFQTFGTPFFGSSTLKINGRHKNRNFKRSETENLTDNRHASFNSHGFCGTEIALTHSETIHTILTRDNGIFGLQFIDAPDGSVLINSVAPDSPAERSQCLYAGDRVLSISHRNVGLDNLNAKDLNSILEQKSDESSCPKLSLHTEFDVLDTVVPSRGVFMVKLVKRGSAGLGITMTASQSSGFIISEMKKGSIAYRAGSLVPGDRLLAINNIPLDRCSVEYAAHIFHQSSNIVTLKIQREDTNTDYRNPRKIVCTVDLQRFGGPLGITIAGSEEPMQPITISGLTSGGLAEQSGVIHVGDEILAINNHSLHGEPLSKAHSLLQKSSDLVSLKISRSIVSPISRVPNNRSPILPSSVDSAVESWDSSHLDLTSFPDHQKPVRDFRDSMKPNINATQQWQSTDPVFQGAEIPEVSSLTSNDDTRNSNLTILDEISSENMKIKQELDLLSIKLDVERNSKLLLKDLPGRNKIACDENIVHKSGELLTKMQNTEYESHGLENGVKESSFGVNEALDVLKDPVRECERKNSLIAADFEKFEMAFMPETRNWCKNNFFVTDNAQESIKSEFQPSQLHEVTLYKDPIYEDFGFSVSDGLYERGVFINRIRKGGPADLSNILKPYDRILQVNNTYTQDFDCCLTVPLIASAGDSLVLLVARSSSNCNSENVCLTLFKLSRQAFGF